MGKASRLKKERKAEREKRVELQGEHWSYVVGPLVVAALMIIMTILFCNH